MRAALPQFRIAIVLTLVLVFALPPQLFAEVVSGSPASPAAALGLKVGRPIEIGLLDGSRIRGAVLELSETAAVIEYHTADGAIARQTIALADMQSVPIPPKVDRWLDRHKWFIIGGIAAFIVVALVYVSRNRQ